MGEKRYSTIPSSEGRKLEDYEGDIHLDDNGNPITEAHPSEDDLAYQKWTGGQESDFNRAMQDREVEAAQQIESSILNGDVELRRMYMIAQQIAALRSGEQVSNNADAIKEKEDQLEAFLVDYNQKDENYYSYRLSEANGKNSRVEAIQADRDKVKAQLDFILNATGSSPDVASSRTDSQPSSGREPSAQEPTIDQVNNNSADKSGTNPWLPQSSSETGGQTNETSGDSGAQATVDQDDSASQIPEVQPAAPEQDPSRTLEDAKAELAAARAEYGALADKQSDRARALRSKIDGLYQEVTDWSEASNDTKGDELEVSGRTLEQAKEELAAARSEYGNLPDKTGEEARRLRTRIDTLYAEVEGWTESDSSKPAAPEQDPSRTLEDAKAELAAARAEYGALADKQSDRARALRSKIDGLYQEVADWENSQELEEDKSSDKEAPADEEAQVDDEEEPTDGEKAKTEAEKAKERREQFDATRNEVMEAYSEEYNAKMRELSEINAKLMTKIWGRRKNTLRAKELEAEIAQLNKKMSKDFLKRAKQNGRYDLDIDDPEKATQALWQMRSDDLVEMAIASDRELYDQTTEQLVARQENRNKFQRFLADMGSKWINKGNLRNLAGGFGSGFAGSALLTAFGATMPVSAAVLAVAGGAGTALTYAGSREAGIADMVEARKSEQYAADESRMNALKEAISAETERMIAESERGKKQYVAEATGDYGGNLLADQRERNSKTNNRLTGRAVLKAASFAAAFTGGSLAGGATANVVKDFFTPPDAGAASGNGLSVADFEPSKYYGGIENPTGGFEFPDGASRITNGEGWFSQFSDMGLTPEQGRAMFNDPGVMDRLVDSGAAYVDNSARIGGYGINMPPSGHLSADAMNIIKEAAIAKGF